MKEKTLRDEIAIAAMNALIVEGGTIKKVLADPENKLLPSQVIAALSYMISDSMMEHR